MYKLSKEQEQLIESNSIDNAFSSIGIETTSSNKIIQDAKENNINIEYKEKEKPVPIQKELTLNDRERAVNYGLIPEHYKDVRFDVDKIKSNLISQYAKSNGLYTIRNFGKYVQVCSEIISTLRMGKLPRRSWIIGAPNGFGKSSFVNECILIMLKSGWNTVPYISLHELAEIRVEEEQRLMRPFSYKTTQGVYNKDANDFLTEKENYNYTNGILPKNIIKNPMIIQSNFSWSQYINAKCLFVHFTDVMSKDLESHVLYQLLSIRGAKGLPTIAMISTSLDPYIKDIQLRELVWDEILAYENSSDAYDRITHVSCYKKKNLDFAKNEKTSNTGIID